MQAISRFLILVLFFGAALSLAACSSAAPTPTTSPPTVQPLTVQTIPAPATTAPPTATDIAPAKPPQAPTDVATVIPPTQAPTTEPLANFVWKQIDAKNAPPARADFALAYNPDKAELVLFGGRAAGQVLGDTWLYEFANNRWREVKTASPSARFGMGGVYDPVSKSVLIFGGQDSEFYNDTWAFDTTSETWREIRTQGDKPAIRYGHGTALNSLNHSLIVSHGFAQDGRHDDTWALDLKSNTWSNITPSGDRPLKRCLLETDYSAQADKLWLFGGCSSGFGPCPQGDLWSLDLKSDTWTQLRPTGETPSARENPALVLDSRTGNLILFGGKAGDPQSDLWIYNPAANAWTKIALEGPAARKSHDAVYDAPNHRIYMFGGATGDGFMNDLWMLEL